MTYRIDGNVIYTDGEEDVHTFVEATANYIKFNDENGDGSSALYFTSEAAQDAEDDCADGGGGGEDLI